MSAYETLFFRFLDGGRGWAQYMPAGTPGADANGYLKTPACALLPTPARAKGQIVRGANVVYRRGYGLIREDGLHWSSDVVRSVYATRVAFIDHEGRVDQPVCVVYETAFDGVEMNLIYGEDGERVRVERILEANRGA